MVDIFPEPDDVIGTSALNGDAAGTWTLRIGEATVYLHATEAEAEMADKIAVAATFLAEQIRAAVESGGA